MKVMFKKRVITHGLKVCLRAGFRVGMALGLVCIVTAGGIAFAGDADAGRVKAETCLGCHGIPDHVNVYPTYHVPKVAGQHEEYLIAALNAYKNKTRPHGTMQANASPLSDEDIADIAAYFASLK